MAPLLPTRCTACGAPGPPLCPPCARALPSAPSPPPPEGVAWCAGLVAYAGAGRAVVAGLKFANRRGALGPLAAALAELVPAARVDVVTWAPTTTDRRRRRGYDQAELLARALAGELRRPVAGLLARVPGPPVTGRSRAARAGAVAFRVRVPAPPRRPGQPAPLPARVLVVDDVRTTGATLAAAARALHAAGVAEVAAATLAVTPARTGGEVREPARTGGEVREPARTGGQVSHPLKGAGARADTEG